ncbi:MAG TPA: DUF481 domain-containing protein [Ohtaekwangia sp.]|nr:DUF481 domain-containing protein [Ohtaekwangia sp.]
MRLLLLILFLLSRAAFAQFNDTTNYYINYTSTGVINKTNDGNSHVLNNNLRFSISKKRVSFNTTNFLIYGKQQGNLSNNDFTSAADLNVYNKGSRRKFYYWGLLQYESSFSLKLHHRLQTGVGIGYNIIDKPNVVVILSDGILYEKSNLYNDAESVRNDYETFRNSFRVKFRWVIRDIITLDGSDFLQHALDDGSDYIIKSNTNLSVKLLKWLSVTASVTYNKLNKTRRENLLVNYGLTFERYF